MNLINRILFIPLTAALLLTACGEDRTSEYIAKTEVAHWIEDQMQDVYLWYNEMPQLDEQYYFYQPDEFFPELLSTQDRFSYIKMLDEALTASIDSRLMHINATATYGIDYCITNDPTGSTTRRFARVLIVLPDSPAAQAGIKRGDWITHLNGREVTTDNSHLLETGNGLTLVTRELTTETVDTETGLTEQIIWASEQNTIELTAATHVENSPYYYKDRISTAQGEVGYLVYNEFATGMTEDDPTDNVYLQEMKEIAAYFSGVDRLILDLRYNNGGYLQCAQELAFILAPHEALGKEFVHLEFNDKHSDQNQTFTLTSLVESTNLDLQELYILTGAYTASASEAIINGLRPYFGDRLKVIGTTTIGKNVAASQYNTPYNFIMFPITATVHNCEGFSDYADGLAPDYEINELNYFPWYDLGDPTEILLRNTISLIENGYAPDATVPSVSASEEPAPSSLLKKQRQAIIAPTLQ